jgi:L-seryl-tRNA(Ser) seleniumtransferase
LAAAADRLQVPLIEDLGSGLFEAAATPFSDHPLANSEPTVNAAIAAGVDVCCFSGDKLLGGPQAGIIAGKTAVVDRIRRHPLMRALRVDKMTFAALEATLAEYAAGRAASTVPVQRMLSMTVTELEQRSERLAGAIAKIAGWRVEIVRGASAIGGGSGPGIELPTCLVAIHRDGLTPDALSARLRTLSPPIVARIDGDRVLLDLRTVLPDEDTTLATLLATV